MSGEGQSAAASCYLDEKTFRLSCQLFLQHSRALKDGWSWEEVKGSEEGYMKRTVLVPWRSSAGYSQHGYSRPEDDADALAEQEDQVDDLEDDAARANPVSKDHAVKRCEYHVLYSCSYQTPTLYFRASTLDGRPLTLEEVWDNVHPNYRQRLQHGPWDTITQQEHPLLGQPFFMLHPCRTEEFMRPVLEAAHAANKRVNYVVTWLSVVGPAVGLDVPLSYSTAVAAPEAAAAPD